jgi:hypothetical protein
LLSESLLVGEKRAGDVNGTFGTYPTTEKRKTIAQISLKFRIRELKRSRALAAVAWYNTEHIQEHKVISYPPRLLY